MQLDEQGKEEGKVTTAMSVWMLGLFAWLGAVAAVWDKFGRISGLIAAIVLLHAFALFQERIRSWVDKKPLRKD